MNVQVNWRENFEELAAGEYFIAVRYPHGFGSYDVATWNGTTWELGYEANVVGWVPQDEFLNGVKAGWPAKDTENFGKPFAEQYEKYRKENPIKDSDEDDFVEFKK